MTIGVRRIPKAMIDRRPPSVDNRLAALQQRLLSNEGIATSVWKEVFAIVTEQESRLKRLEYLIENR
jgi:hypothetical protein